MSSPVSCSLEYLRDKGWSVAICSWWESHSRKRKDLWGFSDLEGYHPDYPGITYFQVTTYSNISARRKKILDNKYAKGLLLCGNRIVIHGWKKNGRMKFKEVIITKEDFDES